jgi:hypothetical protein
MGGRVERCPDGHHEAVRYNSCRHRCCPRCAYRAVEDWLDTQEQRLLAIDHFHVIFTIPSELRPLWEWNKRLMADLLFEVVMATLFKFLDNPEHLGARPGVLAALHTWGCSLMLHPHIHCLVSGGGVTPEGQWKPVTNGYLFPVQAVKVVYRGMLLRKVEQLVRAGTMHLPDGWNLGHAMGALHAAARKKWNVRVENRYEHGVGVATYLARYMRGGPIKSSRLIACDNQGVTFRYGDHRNADARGRAPDAEMTLSLEEFTRRWLRHVPEKGQRVIRAYGASTTTPTTIVSRSVVPSAVKIPHASVGASGSPRSRTGAPCATRCSWKERKYRPRGSRSPSPPACRHPVSTGLPPPTDQVSP